MKLKFLVQVLNLEGNGIEVPKRCCKTLQMRFSKKVYNWNGQSP